MLGTVTVLVLDQESKTCRAPARLPDAHDTARHIKDEGAKFEGRDDTHAAREPSHRGAIPAARGEARVHGGGSRRKLGGQASVVQTVRGPQDGRRARAVAQTTQLGVPAAAGHPVPGQPRCHFSNVGEHMCGQGQVATRVHSQVEAQSRRQVAVLGSTPVTGKEARPGTPGNVGGGPACPGAGPTQLALTDRRGQMRALVGPGLAGTRVACIHSDAPRRGQAQRRPVRRARRRRRTPPETLKLRPDLAGPPAKVGQPDHHADIAVRDVIKAATAQLDAQLRGQRGHGRDSPRGQARGQPVDPGPDRYGRPRAQGGR